MAQNSVRATLILRNDLAATWASRNPILAKGEIGAEIDTGLLKMGDGIKNFNQLNYINLGGGALGDGALITTIILFVISVICSINSFPLCHASR